MNIRQRSSLRAPSVAWLWCRSAGAASGGNCGWALSENELGVHTPLNHMQGDMMHDALRADVLAAFLVQLGDGAAAE